MKYLILSILIILLIPINLLSQWRLQNSGTNSTLNSVDFLNENSGCLAGYNNTIKQSTDGGESWSLYSGWTYPSGGKIWNSISFVNDDDIYVGGRILVFDTYYQDNWTYTTDGGAVFSSWIWRSSWGNTHIKSSFMDVFFLNDNLGWKVDQRGSGGNVYKTTTGVDGGWTLLKFVPNGLYSVMFVDENNGWMVGSEGTVYNTLDGGTNWSSQNSETTKDLKSVYFKNALTGWCVGYEDDQAIILKTTNGGDSWSSTLPLNIEQLHSVYFWDTNIGWACGSIASTPSDKGVILYTENGGVSWEIQHIENNCTVLYDIDFVSNTTGWVVGGSGVILKTCQNPVLGLNPLNLSFSVIQNENLPSSKTFDINNICAGTLNWTASESASWLSISPSSGTNTGTVTVNITNTGLTPGSYTTDVTLSGNAENSPQIVTIDYTVFDIPNEILIVKDEVGSSEDTEYIDYYTDALDANGYLYDIWDTFINGTPSANLLENYHDGVVIWYSGWKNPQLDANERDAVAAYLDNGGRLFYNDQDLGFYVSTYGGIDWYNNYFYSTYIQDGAGLYGVLGVNSDAITNGMNLDLTDLYGGWWPSEIDPIAPATSIFHYNPAATTSATTLLKNTNIEQDGQKYDSYVEYLYKQEDQNRKASQSFADGNIGMGISSSGTAGIKVNNGTYRLVYLAFGFESISDETSRADLMDKIIKWLNLPLNYCSQNGAIIYNTETGKFNFCENGVWVEK